MIDEPKRSWNRDERSAIRELPEAQYPASLSTTFRSGWPASNRRRLSANSVGHRVPVVGAEAGHVRGDEHVRQSTRAGCPAAAARARRRRARRLRSCAAWRAVSAVASAASSTSLPRLTLTRTASRPHRCQFARADQPRASRASAARRATTTSASGSRSSKPSGVPRPAVTNSGVGRDVGAAAGSP